MTREPNSPAGYRLGDPSLSASPVSQQELAEMKASLLFGDEDVATLRPFLEKGGESSESVDAMHHAWLKAVLLQVTLWSHPYVTAADF